MKNLHIGITAVWRKSCGLFCGMKSLPVILLLFFASLFAFVSCEREPELHLHDGVSPDLDFYIVDFDLAVYWDYELIYGIKYNWEAEWYYGWDDEDRQIFGEIAYVEPEVFNLRRFYTGQVENGPHLSYMEDMVYGHTYHGQYNWGFWDHLVWNDIETKDGVQSLVFDDSSIDSVTAHTNATMNSASYNAPYTRSFYQPEQLFAGYSTGLEVNKNLDGFVWDEERNAWVRTLDMVLTPVTYIYLTQVILHHNNGKVSGVDGSSNLSGMARSTNLNTGKAGNDAVTVHYDVRFKKGCNMNEESVDIAGGRLLTFGICNLNPNTVTTRGTRVDIEDAHRHFMDVTMQFNNGTDSTFVFDVTDQVRKRYKGGVLTIELDMDTIPVPARSGGSGFDAVVKDYEDGGTHEFAM